MVKKKLIEVALPLDAINRESAREKSIRHGHPSTLHLWWARRPLAAARAVLWSSLVDDPSSHPDRFPTPEAQEKERQRLFRILEELVKWENIDNHELFRQAHAEIMVSTDNNPPTILDPFSGGGTIPLEALRLGLDTVGGDLNPVAVLIGKGLVEIPARFAGRPSVHPRSDDKLDGTQSWTGARGLTEDIRYYGEWMRERAFERIGHLYPQVNLPDGSTATAIAWIWARTVESPDPMWKSHVPLVRSWVLRNRPGKPVIWVEPMIDRVSQSISYRIREGGQPVEPTVSSGRARCIATDAPIDLRYVDSQAGIGEVRVVPLAVVADSRPGRRYLEAQQSGALDLAGELRLALEQGTRLPDEKGRGTFAGNAQGRYYGFVTFSDYFSDRQLVALTTFSELLDELRSVVVSEAREAGLADDGIRLSEGGSGVVAYADAIQTYLAFVVDKCADYWSTISTWNSARENIRNTFARQAIPMTWDFAETNPFSESSGNWMAMVDWVRKAVENSPNRLGGMILQRDATAIAKANPKAMVSTDPPYYDNIGYADLADFFYVWLRRNLSDVWPDVLSTLLSPKAEELIANPYRHGGKDAAREHFESGMAQVFGRIAANHPDDYPMTVFYAFKQSEDTAAGHTSTGWETFLEGLRSAGFGVTATWPVRTEKQGRPVGIGTSALASSIVLSCRRRPADAPMATRAEFLTALRAELPGAIALLQTENIAPVDLAQSAIGPGMAVFSRFSRVMEADGNNMSVRTALGLINESLQTVLSEEETQFDPDTRWALTWFEQHGTEPGPSGAAVTLSTAKDTSLDGVIRSGIVRSQNGKVILVDRSAMSDDWDPKADQRLAVWEATQHLIRALDRGEHIAADLLRQLGGAYGDSCRQLAYLLYAISERKGWAKEALAYNGLIVAWPEISRLASSTLETGPIQGTLG